MQRQTTKIDGGQGEKEEFQVPADREEESQFRKRLTSKIYFCR